MFRVVIMIHMAGMMNITTMESHIDTESTMIVTITGITNMITDITMTITSASTNVLRSVLGL